MVPFDRPFTSEILKLRRLATQKGLSGLANDSKWNELLHTMRNKQNLKWAPSFRFQCIDSDHISAWERDWWYHLPFPFISVLWFEILYTEKTHLTNPLPIKVIDHSSNLETLLRNIGFEFERGSEALRIFGYAPRTYEGFIPLNPRL